jgi:hypothetical protein
MARCTRARIEYCQVADNIFVYLLIVVSPIYGKVLAMSSLKFNDQKFLNDDNTLLKDISVHLEASNDSPKRKRPTEKWVINDNQQQWTIIVS